jgi:hypothetical protein
LVEALRQFHQRIVTPTPHVTNDPAHALLDLRIKQARCRARFGDSAGEIRLIVPQGFHAAGMLLDGD